jgi:hypothetical protein
MGLTTGVIQGIIVGAVLAFITANLILNAVARAMRTTVDGWSTTLKCSQPGSGILQRAACAKVLPGVNVAQEAAYWTTTVDGAGKALSGRHDYVLHFPAGQLPPNDAFWSLTMTDVQGYMVKTPVDRHSVGDRSNLEQNADGSTDIYIRSAAAAQESNWLPAPTGNFKLWLRAYLPGNAILDGDYHLPPVVRMR